jgi:coenzyme PQQ precursor peptide PqqA
VRRPSCLAEEQTLRHRLRSNRSAIFGGKERMLHQRNFPSCGRGNLVLVQATPAGLETPRPHPAERRCAHRAAFESSAKFQGLPWTCERQPSAYWQHGNASAFWEHRTPTRRYVESYAESLPLKVGDDQKEPTMKSTDKSKKTWVKPAVQDEQAGMEVTSYASASMSAS